MKTRNLLYKREIDINDHLHVMIPTVGEILDNEESYYNLAGMLTAVPSDIDMMVLLDDMGVDFTKVDEYDLFFLMFRELAASDTKLIFGDLDLSKFVIAENEQNGMIVWADPDSGIVIDRAIHEEIADALRLILHRKKNLKKPGNDAAKEFMLERARKKLKRMKKEQRRSQLEEFIVALVNTEQFSYKYDEVRDMTIYQFYESLQQIIHKVEYDNRMYGVYAGTVDIKEISQDDLNWLTHK